MNKTQNYYLDEEKYLKNKYKKINSNPRYKYFYQKHFTAGDEEQFFQNAHLTVKINNKTKRKPTKKVVCKNKFEIVNHSDTFEMVNHSDTFELKDIYHKFKNITSSAVINTFRYMFYKFKKGIYVRIIDNKLDCFLPFSNANFINEWAQHVHLDSNKYNSITDMFRDINEKEGRIKIIHIGMTVKYKNGYKWFFGKVMNIKQGKYLIKNRWYNRDQIKVRGEIFVNKMTCRWYANNGLIRYEYPVVEGDSGVCSIHDMLLTLCKKRSLPDIEFFINKRDFPILTRNETEAYTNIFGTDQKLLSHKYKTYSPIVSMTSNHNFADIPIPTWYDWERSSNQEEHKIFPKHIGNYDSIKAFNKIKWKNKKETAVFRGQTSGIGIDSHTNPRIKLVEMNKLKHTHHNVLMLDAGFTKKNFRPRLIEKTLQTITSDIELVKPLTALQQAEYKYIINVDGHSSAYRLSYELSYGCVILWVKSNYKMWFHSKLKPYVHYVPVSSDLSNLFQQIMWCKKNDKECQKIAKNAQEFYITYLTQSGIVNAFANTLHTLATTIGTYVHPKINMNIPELDNFIDIKKVKSLYLLKHNTKSTIHKGIYDNKDVVIKKYLQDNTSEYEQFVGSYVKHPNLVSIIPNKYDMVVTNCINGITMEHYLETKPFRMGNFLNIFMNILECLEEIQLQYGFIHHDLYPWNIIIQHDENPIIIDFEKAQFVVKNQIYTGLKYIHCDRFYDVLTLLTSSIFIIIQNHKLSPKDVHTIIKLMNVLKNTFFVKHIFTLLGFPEKTEFKSISDITLFTRYTKQYNFMNYICKHDITSFTPKDMIRYLNSNISPTIKYNSNMIDLYTYDQINELSTITECSNFEKLYNNALKPTLKKIYNNS